MHLRKLSHRANKAWPLPLLAALLAPGASAPAQGGPAGLPFPVPRAEKDFAALMPDLIAFARHDTQGDLKAFINAVTIYGPLDLQVRRARTPQEASYLRDFHLGIAAAASGVPPALAARLGRPFSQAPAEVRARRQRLVGELTDIEVFVGHLRATPQVRLLAQWGFQGSYRVNDAVVTPGPVEEAVPSPTMGFVPSGRWRHYSSLASYLATIRVSASAVQTLYAQFEPLRLVAADRTRDGGTEIIGLGLANNTSGLLFDGKASARPQVGRRLPDGRRYADVEVLKPGVFYFETD